MILLLFACTPVDGTRTGPATPAETTPSPFEGPAPAEGGTLVAWGAGGVYAGDATGLVRLGELAYGEVPVAVNGSGGYVAVAEADTIRVYPIAGGAPVFTHAAAALDGVRDLLWQDEGVWVARGPDLPVLRVGSDGTEVEQAGVFVDGLQADQGAVYARLDLGREGTTLTPVDPASLTPVGDAAWAGFGAHARGASLYASYGEIGNSAAGGYTLSLWGDAGSDLGAPLPDGRFATALDALYGRAALVDVIVAPDWTPAAVLVGPDGSVADTLPGCASPVLAWVDDGLEGWCAAPLRRLTWAWGDAGWTRTGEEVWAEDVAALQWVEPGD